MAVRELTAPAGGRIRKGKYPFTSKEIAEAVKMLENGKTPGVGPYEGEHALREARSAGQSLIRQIKATDPEAKIGTRAWVDDNGDAFCSLRLRPTDAS